MQLINERLFNTTAASSLPSADYQVFTPNDILAYDIHATNTDASPATLTISDGAGMIFAAATPIAAGGDYERTFANGIFFKSGLKAKSGTNNVVHLWVRFRNA